MSYFRLLSFFIVQELSINKWSDHSQSTSCAVFHYPVFLLKCTLKYTLSISYIFSTCVLVNLISNASFYVNELQAYCTAPNTEYRRFCCQGYQAKTAQLSGARQLSSRIPEWVRFADYAGR